MVKIKNRLKLRECLLSYIRSDETIFGLKHNIYALIRSGLDDEFSEREKKLFYGEFVPVIDAYDQRFKPRIGVFGKIKDIMNKITGASNRISEDSVKDSVRRLLEWI